MSPAVGYVGRPIYEVELRGSEKAHHVHNVILHYAAAEKCSCGEVRSPG